MSLPPLRKLKDAALAQAVSIFVRPKFERYGELCWLKVNTAEKILRAEVKLKGELEPIRISRARYRLDAKGDQKLLVIYDVKISKEWAQNLLEDRFKELPIAIPDFVSSLLS